MAGAYFPARLTTTGTATRWDVWAGESYAVELTAINGTGYKGDCSYRDENTGEIRVYRREH